MPDKENLDLVSDTMEIIRKAADVFKHYRGPLPDEVVLADDFILTEKSSWDELVTAYRMWDLGGWHAEARELKALSTWACKTVPANSAVGRFIRGAIDEEEMVTQVALPVSATLEDRRLTILEVILRHAASGEEWKESLAGLMVANEITLNKSKKMIRRAAGKDFFQ
ncbi:MAG: hypothetical protein R3C24_13425 [Cyanobacteriota/Melainabacteria group bacterium]